MNEATPQQPATPAPEAQTPQERRLTVAEALGFGWSVITLWAPGWRITTDTAKRRAGVCRYHRREISISVHYIAAATAADVQDTILHEIAHAVAGPGTGHGPAWVRACEQVGARPERCYDGTRIEMPKGIWRAECPECGKHLHRHRRPSRSLYHATCSPRSTLQFRRTDGK